MEFLTNINKIEEWLKKNKVFYKSNEYMKHHTTFKIGGVCKILVYPQTLQEAGRVVRACEIFKVKHFFLGNGSNMLFTDSDFLGVAVCSQKLCEIKLVDDNKIYCESGVALIDLCRFALLNSLSGLEFAYGIPGSLGGAVLMNAGAYGGEIKDVIENVVYSDKNGKLHVLKKDELKFAYRSSVFSNTSGFVLAATIKCVSGNYSTIKQKMDELMARRIEKQPLTQSSAGSTFKRPSRGYASQLIESCGLKGAHVGDAMVSRKHSGFIVNLGNASCCNVLELISKVQGVVKQKTGILLEPEVKIIK